MADLENTSFQNNLVFALDIGTRSIIGMVGRLQDDRVNILAVERRSIPAALW